VRSKCIIRGNDAICSIIIIYVVNVMKKVLLFLMFGASLVSVAGQVPAIPQLGKDPVKKVISVMTLEEKATLVVGAGRAFNIGGQQQNTPTAPMVGHTEDLVAGAAGTTYAIPRLGIPQMVVADGPAGLRISPTRQNDSATYYCTAFPVATLLASSWDTELARRVGRAMGNEVLEYGVDVLLGPAMNIQNNPLCGRNFEYFSEDPVVAGEIAAAVINGVESMGVGTSVKHFAANNMETNRNVLDANISQRALREIYLRGFEIAVEKSQPWTIMSSYNLINGTYTSESYDLLTRILRNDWKFKGFVMTDWGGGRNPAAQMHAGNDLLMPGNAAQTQAIIDAVKQGKLDINDLDRNVERILNILLQTPRFNGYKYSNKPDLKGNAEVARQAASEGMVLLKNDNGVLPLAQEVKKIAAFGKTSYEIVTGGTGSGDVNEAYSVALVEGLHNAGYSVNENLQVMYSGYLKSVNEGRPRGRGFFMPQFSVPELGVPRELVNSMAAVNDIAIITIGRNAGEGRDRSPDEGDFMLTTAERELIETVTSAFHEKSKKVIVILNIGGVIETASWKHIPDAILLAWQPGQEAGNSIADILCGTVNPSGKLAATFPVKYEDVPSAIYFPGKALKSEVAEVQARDGQPARTITRVTEAEVTYQDGVYVGYRYYNSFNVPVSYEFGYGLSYTTFDFSPIKLSSNTFSRKLTLTLEVKNKGDVAGKEVVQLYISAPDSKMKKPESELRAFSKTRLLKPGESQVITFEIIPKALASFDTPSSSWVAAAGTYTVKLGASSKDIRQTASFSLGREMTVEKVSNALTPRININELTK
jgi:beta-glucosidase